MKALPHPTPHVDKATGYWPGAVTRRSAWKLRTWQLPGFAYPLLKYRQAKGEK